MNAVWKLVLYTNFHNLLERIFVHSHGFNSNTDRTRLKLILHTGGILGGYLISNKLIIYSSEEPNELYDSLEGSPLMRK